MKKLPVIELSQDEKPKKKKPAVKKVGNLPAKRGRKKKENTEVSVAKVKKVAPKKARKKKEKKQFLSQPPVE